MTVFWKVVLCGLVVYRRFRGACCLHQQNAPNEWGSKHLWNVGTLLPDYTSHHPRTRSSLKLFTFCRSTKQILTCDEATSRTQHLDSNVSPTILRITCSRRNQDTYFRAATISKALLCLATLHDYTSFTPTVESAHTERARATCGANVRNRRNAKENWKNT
jgi:hypothetical protein